MPKKGQHGEFAPLPSTLERSPQKAQDTYEETLEHAEQEYDGDEARASRRLVRGQALVRKSRRPLGAQRRARAVRSTRCRRRTEPRRPHPTRRRERGQVEGRAPGRGARAGRARYHAYEEGRTGRGDREGQRPQERRGAQALARKRRRFVQRHLEGQRDLTALLRRGHHGQHGFERRAPPLAGVDRGRALDDRVVELLEDREG